MPTSSANTLFYNGNLVETLDEHINNIDYQVNEIPRDQFLVSSDDEIVAYVLSRMYIEPIVLRYEDANQEIAEATIDIGRYREKRIADKANSFLVPGTRVRW